MSPYDWNWNEATREWIVYSSKHGYWVNKEGEQLRKLDKANYDKTPQPPSSSSKPAAPRRRESDAVRDASLAAEFKKFQLQDKPQKAAPALIGPRNYVAEDSKTGDKTRWHIGETEQYTDPTTSQQHQVALKHARSEHNGSGRQGQAGGKGNSIGSKRGRAVGKIIEVPIVPLSTSGASGVNTSTAANEGRRIRPYRFAIVEELPDDQFRAIAIKTYQGEGVSQQIKSHHSQIYVGKQVPPIRQDENPGIRNGKTESPMQTHAVCVEPYDNYQTLDPLSRLDYCDRVDFDFDDPQIRLFGSVTRDSKPFLVNQYNSVLRNVAAAVRGPTTTSYTGEATIPQQHASRSKATGPAIASGSSGGPGPHGAPPPLQYKPKSTAPAAPAQGKTTVEQVTKKVREMRDYANREGLKWPVNLTQGNLETMADDYDFYAATLKQIADLLKEQREEEQDEDEDEDDD